jgi:SUMO ligase MMS21 Smc5/6 complex component
MYCIVKMDLTVVSTWVHLTALVTKTTDACSCATSCPVRCCVSLRVMSWEGERQRSSHMYCVVKWNNHNHYNNTNKQCHIISHLPEIWRYRQFSPTWLGWDDQMGP